MQEAGLSIASTYVQHPWVPRALLCCLLEPQILRPLLYFNSVPPPTLKKKMTLSSLDTLLFLHLPFTLQKASKNWILWELNPRPFTVSLIDAKRLNWGQWMLGSESEGGGDLQIIPPGVVVRRRFQENWKWGEDILDQEPVDDVNPKQSKYIHLQIAIFERRIEQAALHSRLTRG